MIKKTAICAFLFFSFLLSAFFPEGRVFADTSVDVDDPLNLLLTGDDLLPLCDWQQMQIVTRPIAAGMMTFHTLYCNDEGIERRVFQTILVTRRNFRPGDGNALITGADIGKDQSHIDIGNWATHFSAMHDNAAVVFTEQNVFEYIGINYEYSMGGKNDENLVELARIAADRIPDRKVEPEIQSINTGQSVDNEFVESISKNRPDVRFYEYDGEMPVVRAGGDALGPMYFAADFIEPQRVVIEIQSLDSDINFSRLIFYDVQYQIIPLDELIRPCPEPLGDYLNEVFFASGDYVLSAFVDENLIYQTQFRMERY